MQYDIDILSPNKYIFYKLKDIILCFNDIYEKKNAKQTAYYDAYSAICFLRPYKLTQCYCIAFANGAKLITKYPMLEGNGKIVRHLYFSNLNEIDCALIKEIINESLILNLEKYELKQLTNFKHNVSRGTLHTY
jgi:hypothetical protein